MSYVNVKSQVKGNLFTYRHEFTAQGVGSPLREDHVLRVGGEEISIQRDTQVNAFLRQNGLPVFVYEMPSSKIVALKKDDKSFLVMSFDQTNQVSVSVQPRKKLKKSLSLVVQAQKALLSQKFKQEAEKLMNVMDQFEAV